MCESQNGEFDRSNIIKKAIYAYTYTINEQNLKLGVTWHASYGL